MKEYAKSAAILATALLFMRSFAIIIGGHQPPILMPILCKWYNSNDLYSGPWYYTISITFIKLIVVIISSCGARLQILIKIHSVTAYFN